MQYFTVQEANTLLPTVERLVKGLFDTHKQIVTLRPKLTEMLEKDNADTGGATASQMYLAFLRFEEILRTIQALGVSVKDPASGLIDFPALHEGRDIWLCWQLGEQEVEWWHEVHTGFAGRRHVSELL